MRCQNSELPTSLDFDAHLVVLDLAAESLAVSAELAGPDALVRTCRRWQVRNLVAHQGKIHRWAAGIVGGRQGTPMIAVSDSHLIQWYREGCAATGSLSV